MFERTVRVAAPGALAVFMAFGVAFSNQPFGLALTAGLAVVALGVALSVREAEGWALSLTLVLIACLIGYLCNAGPANLGWFGLCIATGWCAVLATTRHTVVLVGVIALLLLVQWLQVLDEPGWAAWLMGTLFTAVACDLGRRQRMLLMQLEAAQAGLADRARAEERNRIAGEMHDIIGHALTVSLLHVSSARLALDEDPDEARASLEEAERLARSSLDEVRASVGMMRSTSADTAPLPGLANLDPLLESFRRAGTPVSCEITGDPTALPAMDGLAVYRILQESLTNVARHAPGGAAAVRVDIGDATRVVVDSSGAPGRRTTEGNGLVGMRERAESVGGRLSAGPFDGGWRVEAVLPS